MLRIPLKHGIVVVVLAGTFLCRPPAARALPVFAHRYDLSCQVCHTTIPHLNAFGAAFLRAGFRLPPGFHEQQAFPVALKVNLQYSSEAGMPPLPKAIVDEVELLAGGTVSRHVSYRLEQYLVDGGERGLTRDAWLQFSSRPTFGDSGSALRVTAGEFTLPLPVDPETQRETINHYLIFDQTVGANPFNFFDDRIGVDAAFGRATNGADVHVLALKGHDPQSGLPTSGADSMLYVQTGGRTTLSAYYYDGTRRFDAIVDSFHRQGVGATLLFDKAQIDLLAQSGADSHPNATGSGVTSSGGFAQARWAFSPALTALARYDRAYSAASGLQQSLTTTLVARVRHNSKITVEDLWTAGHQTLNAAFLVAY